MAVALLMAMTSSLGRGMLPDEEEFVCKEVQHLYELVTMMDQKNHGLLTQKGWQEIARAMGKTVQQCTEMWFGYLANGVSRADWTPEEDAVIIETYKRFGPKWNRISSFLSNRTDIQTKHRFYDLFVPEALPWFDSFPGGERAYLAYVDSLALPGILIVGSGRRTVRSTQDYAETVYRNPELYFLVDIDPNTGADTLCDIRELPRYFDCEMYDVVIFECVDTDAAFSRAAIGSALALLKPGGVLISSSVPMCVHWIPVRDVATRSKDCKRIDLDGWVLFYKDDNECSSSLYPNERRFGVQENAITVLSLNKKVLSQQYLYDMPVEDSWFLHIESCNPVLWPCKEGSKVGAMILQKAGGTSGVHPAVLSELRKAKDSYDIKRSRERLSRG
ncbi:MAG: hypothetical protein LBD15_03000 [Holosporales bacterium]|nr:hypothetical protein [Holosporales bacterium]